MLNKYTIAVFYLLQIAQILMSFQLCNFTKEATKRILSD
jgi:hypothetical protein